jgi:hypothetical protein
MHAKNFLSEFLDILKNNYWLVGASTPGSQSGFPVSIIIFYKTTPQILLHHLTYKCYLLS